MKQRIRITESDLHRIVKESVLKILSEAQLNELDARTYASYAKKRQQQADNALTDQDAIKYQRKAWQGRNAAVNAWNNKYQGGKRGPGEYGDEMLNDYSIRNSYNDNNSVFNPNDNTYTETPKSGGVSSTKQLGHFYQAGDPGWATAQQMAKGNGKYVKGNGWH